jgi:hypothetical protein
MSACYTTSVIDRNKEIAGEVFAPDEDFMWEVVAAVILEECSVQGDSQLIVLTSSVYS